MYQRSVRGKILFAQTNSFGNIQVKWGDYSGICYRGYAVYIHALTEALSVTRKHWDHIGLNNLMVNLALYTDQHHQLKLNESEENHVRLFTIDDGRDVIESFKFPVMLAEYVGVAIYHVAKHE